MKKAFYFLGVFMSVAACVSSFLSYVGSGSPAWLCCSLAWFVYVVERIYRWHIHKKAGLLTEQMALFLILAEGFLPPLLFNAGNDILGSLRKLRWKE